VERAMEMIARRPRLDNAIWQRPLPGGVPHYSILPENVVPGRRRQGVQVSRELPMERAAALSAWSP